MGAHDRNPSDPAIFRHKAPKVVRRRSFPEVDTPGRSRMTSIEQIHLGARGTLGPPPQNDDPHAYARRLPTAGRGSHWTPSSPPEPPGYEGLPAPSPLNQRRGVLVGSRPRRMARSPHPPPAVWLP
jgi:hypothetical protein